MTGFIDGPDNSDYERLQGQRNWAKWNGKLRQDGDHSHSDGDENQGKDFLHNS